MKVNVNFFLASNPFYDAYVHSDFLGKGIFLGLIALSICSWTILIYKIWITYRARNSSSAFYNSFQQRKSNPLGIDGYDTHSRGNNPFLHLYLVLRKHTIDLLNKNRRFATQTSKIATENGVSYLSPSDIDFVDAHLMSSIASIVKDLDKNLFVLSTTVSLGPFLGLLGTVWGILTTFSELQSQAGANTNQMVLGGLSLALATTVLGLLDAIPALVGYNYLKNVIRDFETEMTSFSTEILASVEIQYRKVDVN